MPEITSDYRALDALREHPKNPNKHTRPGVIERTAEKIRLIGFTSPPICNLTGLLLGGHLRRLALLKLRADGHSAPKGIGPGWQVPVRLFEGSAAEELAVLAGDNPDPADYEMSEEELAALLEGLAAEGPDLLAAAGYSAERTQELLDALQSGEPPEIPNPTAPSEPQLVSEVFIEIYCTNAALETMRGVLDEWASRGGVTVNIS